MDIIKEGQIDIPSKLEQELETAQLAQLPKNEAEKFLILGAEKDSKFAGSIIIKIKENGIVKGYAIRKKEDGSLEGNEINYQENGSMGAVNQLHESDFDKLKQEGILEAYEGALADEKGKSIDAAKLTMLRMYMQGEKFDPAWNKFPEDSLMGPAKDSLKNLGLADQEKLAADFFNDTIGKDISNNRNAYKVYLIFKGTSFGQKFKQLEDERLKKAGYAGFTL